MDKLESQISKEATWRNRLARHAASGKSIAAFCRDESISQANFHVWCRKLADGADERVVQPAPQSTFIDLGVFNRAIAGSAPEHLPAQVPLAMPGIDIRIDLGGGVVLTIARR